MRDFEDFGEKLAEELPEKTETDDGSSYFEPFENDKWGRRRNLTPIEFDWSRICELDAVEEDKKWYETPFYKHMCEKGFKHQRWLVCCATHGYFKQIVMDPPTPKIGFKCQKCITDEINRIIDLRARREREFRKSRGEEI